MKQLKKIAVFLFAPSAFKLGLIITIGFVYLSFRYYGASSHALQSNNFLNVIKWCIEAYLLYMMLKVIQSVCQGYYKDYRKKFFFHDVINEVVNKIERSYLYVERNLNLKIRSWLNRVIDIIKGLIFGVM